MTTRFSLYWEDDTHQIPIGIGFRNVRYPSSKIRWFIQSGVFRPANGFLADQNDIFQYFTSISVKIKKKELKMSTDSNADSVTLNYILFNIMEIFNKFKIWCYYLLSIFQQYLNSDFESMLLQKLKQQNNFLSLCYFKLCPITLKILRHKYSNNF